MISNALSCPACTSQSVRDLGSLPNRKGTIILPDPGRLHACGQCGMMFRHPYPRQDELAALYGTIEGECWAYPHGRPDWDFARAHLTRCLPRRATVLDVGCFDGGFLASLPESVRKFGLEVSPAPAKLAQGVGVTILGGMIDDLDTNLRFDAITLFDVVEHLPDPLSQLRRLRQALKPDGQLLLSTGNTDALPWRLMRNDYWYYYPDHVTFLNPGWFRWAAGRMDMRLTSVHRFSRDYGSTTRRRMRQLMRCTGFWAYAKMRRWPRLHRAARRVYPFSRVAAWPRAPRATYWPDHMAVVLTAGAEGTA